MEISERVKEISEEMFAEHKELIERGVSADTTAGATAFLYTKIAQLQERTEEIEREHESLKDRLRTVFSQNDIDTYENI